MPDMSSIRLYQGNGKRAAVTRCIECPKFPTCNDGWWNDNPAKTVAEGCKLISIKPRTAARIEREAENE
jgi:hypothetical protein